MIKDLPLHPFPNPLLPRLKEVKSQLALDFQVKPRAARYGDGRVLATMTPNFICDYALVRGTDEQDVRDALLWTLGAKDDYRSHGAADALGEWFGGNVVEIHETGLSA